VQNLTIKSGTNQLHGTAYYYNRNEALAAESPFTPPGQPKNALRNQNWGASLGGPIWRDHTFFFLDYEEQKYIIGNQARATEPSVAYQAAALAAHAARSSLLAVRPWRKSTAFCACAAALKIARLSFCSTLSQHAI
jgi:hypothetical protein